MTTGKLLWGMTWRGAVWGTSVGFSSSILGSILAELGLVISELTKPKSSLSSSNYLVDFIQLGITLLGIIGYLPSLIGFRFGAIVGFILGVFTPSNKSVITIRETIPLAVYFIIPSSILIAFFLLVLVTS